eukprot:FR738909.1.p1 GENE.FR738909.1~~FR738909.1.p1  ORF type:complete len:192 (-),score=5.44 FR738909.1:120-695(-)
MPSETWITRFNPHSPSMLLSGADDALLKGWDLRCDSGVTHGDIEEAVGAFTIRGQHDAGVTSLCWCPNGQHIFASGSYDESVRMWDIRSLKTPISCTQVGGGVWRLKWHPTRSLIGVAAMHGGAHLLNVANIADPCLVGSYLEHESMAYGIDWCFTDIQSPPSSISLERPLMASCSFYDSALHLWRTPITT